MAILIYTIVMTGRTHDLAAFTALGVTAIIFPVENITLATGITAIIANMIGGIAPDIDQPTAPFWRNLPIGGVVGRTLTRMLGGHRFLSHSIIGIFIFGYGFQFILNLLQPSFPNLNLQIIWTAFMIGFISHLIMDTFTREGVPWLLPIPVKIGLPPIRMFRIPTGGFIERFIIFPTLIIFNLYFYFSNYNLLLSFINNHIK